MFQHILFDKNVYKGLFKIVLNTYLSKERSRSKEKSMPKNVNEIKKLASVCFNIKSLITQS